MIHHAATRRAGRILLTGLLVVNLMLGYLGQAANVQAQIIKDPIDTSTSGVTGNVPTYGGVENSIRDYLCVPDESNLGTALFTCITKLYRFGIAFGGIALVFFVVFAGYMYMTGGETGKGKAKGILLSAITGMAIMLSSYVLLNFINPDLVKIKPIQPPIFTANVIPDCKTVGLGVNCILPNGQVNYPGGNGPLGVGRWKDLINKYSAQYNIDTCVGYTIVRKESVGGDPSSIGHDNHNRASDPFQANSPTYYGLQFTGRQSHGIGLTQVTIFPEGSTQGGGNWPNFPTINGKKTPARRASDFPIKGGNNSATTWYTIADLLVPDTSVKLALGHMALQMEKNNNNLEASFKAYNGGQVYATSAMQIYNNCKRGEID